MDSTLTALFYRTWIVLRSHALAMVSTELARQSELPFADFCLCLLKLPAIETLQKQSFTVYDNEHLIYLPLTEPVEQDCIVTNRKVLVLDESNHYQQTLFSRIARHKLKYSSRRDETKVTLKLKNGAHAALRLRGSCSGPAIEFGLKDEHSYPSASITDEGFVAEVEFALANPEFKAVFKQSELPNPDLEQPKPDNTAWTPDTLSQSKPKSVAAEPKDAAEEGSILAEFRPWLLGFLAFAGFLLANGAPLFDGGPAVIRWLSVNDNMAYFYGAVILALAAPWVWPRKKR